MTVCENGHGAQGCYGKVNTAGHLGWENGHVERNHVTLYSGHAEGLNPEPEHIDTLSEAVHLSRTAEGDILVISKKEKIAALHDADSPERFPTILKTPGDVLAGCAVETSSECWLVAKSDSKELQLLQMDQATGTVSTHALDLQNDPTDLLAFELPGGKVGLIFFMPYDAPKMQLFDGSKLEELNTESFRALAQPLVRSNIRLAASRRGDTLFVSQGAIARRFEWDGERYTVAHQYNPENPRGELIASCSYRFLDGSTGTLLYDRNTADLIRFDSNETDGWKIQIPDADPTIFDLVQLKNPDRDTVVLIDRSGLSTILGNGTRLGTVSAAEYISPSDNPKLAYAKLVRLGSPQRTMIALIDPANRSIELVSQHDEGLKTELAFEVFLTSDFADQARSRGTEPHDVECGDLNGDGINDLVVLSQDKLLIYLGE